MHQVDSLGLRDAPQGHDAIVPEAEVAGALGQLAHQVGHRDLAACAGRGDACRHVDRVSEEVVPPANRLSGVHADSHEGHALAAPSGGRETPLNRIHIRNMDLAASAGATIYPLIPTFYNRPQDIDAMAHQFACRVLAFIGLPQPDAYQWKG